MAELTYDPTPADQGEFSAEELDSLAVGEQMMQAQEQLLAGKYENAEQLEKAYIELQSKLGERSSTEQEPEGDAPEEVEYEEEELQEEVEWSDAAVAIANAAGQYNETGEISDEMMQQLSQMSSEELVQAYVEHFADDIPAPDLSVQEVNQIKNFAGGEDSYNELVGWAAENMDSSYLEAFNGLVDSGDLPTIQLAVAGLMATYQETNGYEGRMLSGTAAQDTSLPVFRSQAEVVAAMSDPRYDTDPAYRQDVYEALDRSNLQY